MYNILNNDHHHPNMYSIAFEITLLFFLGKFDFLIKIYFD